MNLAAAENLRASALRSMAVGPFWKVTRGSERLLGQLTCLPLDILMQLAFPRRQPASK